MISVMLTALMGLMTFVAVLMRRRSPAVSLGLAGVSVLGTWFAWNPEHLNVLAHAVGVGRGADLALYLGLSLVLLSLAGLLFRLRHLERRFTDLARESALAQARARATGRGAVPAANECPPVPPSPPAVRP